ncbi:MAG: type II toxin-antitoxin system VapB family antitoxin [Candidatus Sulfotelmatobacter sp.]
MRLQPLRGTDFCQAGGHKSKKAAVTEALRESIKRRKQVTATFRLDSS